MASEIARDILGAERMIFGTDYPSALKEAPYEHYVNYILEADGFSLSEKELILGENADRVFFS